MTLEPAGPALSEAIVTLTEAVRTLTNQLDPPRYVGTPPDGHFRYAKPTSQVMQVLKAVRVVTGLRGTLRLLYVGLHQEAAVVLRATNDAIHDIAVLDEAHYADEAKQYQRRLVDEFFQDDAQRLPEILAGKAQPVPRVPRRKKLAAIERRMAPAAAGEPTRPQLEALVAVLDGYTHAAYSQIMELYSGTSSGGRFHLEGIDYEPRQRMMLVWTALFTHSALTSVIGLLKDFGLAERASEVRGIRIALEESDEYPSG